MTDQEFVQNIREILDCGEELTADTVLETVDAWDSLAMLSVMAFFKQTFNVSPGFQEMKGVKTVADLILLSKK
ncbi:MAG: acyl carrier protein [Alphaproteobacteria bacterium]|nr:acyl carrier protein [Alphaproteobacteria bacterium]